MTPNLTESLRSELDSYRSIARSRKPAAKSADDGGRANWMHFAAAAGASLAGATTAEAAIQHVIPPAPIRVETSLTYIDLDGDATEDLRLGAGFILTSSSIANYWIGTAYGLSDAALVGDATFGSSYVAIRKFAPNAVIPAQQPALFGSYLRSSLTTGGFPATNNYINGNWGLNDVGFAGFVLGLNDPQPRAGWIKIRTSQQNSHLGAIEILEWAFETVPGVSILAGEIPGDYDGSGVVDILDYNLWKNTFGQTVPAGNGADGDSNTKIDAADFTVWRDNLGDHSGTGAIAEAAPEPSTVTLGVLALGAAGIAALRRRSP